MKKQILPFFVTVLALFSSPTQAADYPVVIDLPLYDYPYNSIQNAPDYYSMRQSMAVSNSFLQTSHYLIGGDDKETPPDWWRFLLVGGFDYATSAVPVGNGWAHEEWHRAVMKRRKIASFNDMNKFPWGQGVIAVSHVNDQDLINLKKYYPAEQVRMSSAGMEAQVFQNQTIEESHFFKGARSRDVVMLWFNALNTISYMQTCATTDADKETDTQMNEEGSDVTKRDFTGLDCTAWAYDLFRPDEPYQSRGTHPSGIGIKRYIKFSDLSPKEQEFLKLQTKLSYLNLVDPFLLNLKEFNTTIDGLNVRWNFKLNHYMTSFGGVVNANLFADVEGHKFVFVLHNGMTDTRYLPGVTLKWVDAEINKDWNATLSGTIWQQPKNQRIETTAQETLLHGSAELAYKYNDRWNYYVGYEYKNAGWVAGNVYLDDSYQIWTGIRVGLF